MNRYHIIIETTPTGYSAYSPDLPGCIVTGQTREEMNQEMHDAMEFHIEPKNGSQKMNIRCDQPVEPNSNCSAVHLLGDILLSANVLITNNLGRF